MNFATPRIGWLLQPGVPRLAEEERAQGAFVSHGRDGRSASLFTNFLLPPTPRPRLPGAWAPPASAPW
ncbi:MAG: hypothetical protein ACLTMP_04310 [Eggerthella lenta]